MLIEKLAGFGQSQEVPPKCPFVDSGIKLTNFISGKRNTDVLHANSVEIKCTSNKCTGSLMSGQSRTPATRTKEEVLEEALKFQEEYLESVKGSTEEDLCRRMQQISREVGERGTYDMSAEELCYGARLAWRNASRCIGRIQWSKLYLNDARDATCTNDMFRALCTHLEYATNGGNIRSTITVFPSRIEGREDFKVWNPQLITFAGYLQPDGSVVGDPGRVQITRICQRLGWKGLGGRFDVLPWLLSAPGEGVKLYEIPEHLLLLVELEHPRLPWFRELGLRWYAVPAVSEMLLDVGGISFTAAPFNGWYMATEIGARNICDLQRYNLSKEIAEKMGLDTMTPTSLWKDIVLVETTLAVIHSFQKNKVTIVDHHTAADTFMKHLETEQRERGGCPADWVWIVPPISGSSTPVFHQEMINYNLRPSYEYQEKPWISYQWPDKVKLKYSFASIAKVVRVCLSMMSKARMGRTQATILYASETGKSETYARKLGNLIHSSFNTKVLCMDDYDISSLTSEDFVIVVASTFGSGEPPDNGKDFYKHIKEMKERKKSLKSLKYAVFALGSSQYPNFCNFGKNVDQIFSDLGAKRILPVELGDELRGQEHAFNLWLPAIYQSACKDFNIEFNDDMILNALDINTWKRGQFRMVPSSKKEKEILSELSRLHHKKMFSAQILDCTNLQSPESDRKTMLIRLKADESTQEPGDHVSIFPSNPTKLVNDILKKLEQSGVNTSEVLQTEILKGDCWRLFDRLPAASLRTLLSRYLDICTPPSPSFLHLLSEMANDPRDKERLARLSEGTEEYEAWKSFNYPNLLEVLCEFPSVRLEPSFLVCELPLLQPRYYSCSSSRRASPGEIHVTCSLVAYRTRDNEGPLHFGVCTSYLNNAPTEDILCYIRSAPRFRLPEDPLRPVLLIGAGSGIAPFRSFWQERAASPAPSGPLYLFFGGRRDDLYREEREAMVQQGVITRVVTALSREPGQPKKYVQHKLMEESEIVLNVISNGGHVYVCGDAVMATDVRATIDKILEDGKTLDVDMLVDNGKYHEDVFGVLHKK